MIAVNKIIGLIVLFYQHGYVFGQNCPNTTVVKQDTAVVMPDSICCKSDICESDTARHKRYLRLPGISAISQGQTTTQDIDPNALKMPKFDPDKKKFTDMQLINMIGPHIKR
jgi:hypothetical protein